MLQPSVGACRAEPFILESNVFTVGFAPHYGVDAARGKYLSVFVMVRNFDKDELIIASVDDTSYDVDVESTTAALEYSFGGEQLLFSTIDSADALTRDTITYENSEQADKLVGAQYRQHQVHRRNLEMHYPAAVGTWRDQLRGLSRRRAAITLPH